MDTSASDAAFTELRRRLLDGHYPPGSFLSNQGLAVELKLSRTPVRDALRRLEAEGLVEIAPRSGATVRDFSPDEIVDLYVLRSALEPNIAAIAAERRSSIDLANMRRCADALARHFEAYGKEAPDNDDFWKERAELDYQFHYAIVQGAHSKVLSQEYTRLQIWITLYYHSPHREAGFAVRSFSKPERVLAEHEAVVNAIEERNADEAYRLMAQHLLEAHGASLPHHWLHRAVSEKMVRI